jgi:hypothetical protein
MAVLILEHGREFIFANIGTTVEGENWSLQFLVNRIFINILKKILREQDAEFYG